MDDESFDLAMTAASLRADAGDVTILIRVLSDHLAEALGPRFVVERAGGLLKRSKEITAIRITLGDDTYEGTVEQGTLRCSIGHTSGGIKIRTEKLEVDEWLDRLLAALKAEADQSLAVRQALENIVIGGST